MVNADFKMNNAMEEHEYFNYNEKINEIRHHLLVPLLVDLGLRFRLHEDVLPRPTEHLL
jgi:hypothetical protein